MTARELKIGDVFRIAGEDRLWRKVNQTKVVPHGWRLNWPGQVPKFTGRQLELVERAAGGEIRRAGDTLILRDGEVTLQFLGAWGVVRCTPGEPLTELILTGDSFGASVHKVPTTDTALGFVIGAGAKHLGRPPRSEVFAFGGRVYGRATKEEAGSSARGAGGYKRSRVVDGKKRLVIAGVLGIAGEFALYDIMMEHFGPDTVAAPG